MKKKTLTFLASFFTVAAVGFCAISIARSGDLKMTKAEEKEPEPEIVNADLSRFRIRSGNAGTYSVLDSTITYTGGWDSNFLVTDQFDTLSSNYSISAHVSHDSYAGASEGYFGLALYLDATTYMTFQLKWDASVVDTISEGVWLNHVGAAWDGVYQSAVVPGDYETRPTFTDVWSDGMWRSSKDGPAVNMRGNSVVELNKGFDITYFVNRAEYKGRLADLIYCRIDAFAADGSTPASFYSPTYAVDAFTNPLGLNDTRVGIKPQIGFHESSITNVKISNIKFTDYAQKEVSANVRKMGVPEAVNITTDFDNDTVTIDNHHTCGGGAVLENLGIDSHNYHISADISGVGDNTDHNAAGFTIYYDDLNFFNVFFEWNGVYTSIPGVTMHWFVDGNHTDVTTALRNPWNDSVINGEWGANFSDFGGWCTDAYIAEGADSNFNNFRDECSDITIGSGFTMTLDVARVTRNGLLYDEICLSVSALDKSGVRRNWYMCAVYFDAYTNPKGGEPSKLIDVFPTIALYGCHTEGVTSSVTFSNIKLNNSKVDIAKPSELTVNDPELVFKKGSTFGLGADASVTLTYDSGVEKTLNANEYTITAPAMDSIGEKEVTVSSNELSSVKDSYNIDVVELDSIVVDETTAVTTYTIHEDFVEPTVYAKYTNGSDILLEEEAEGVVFSGYDMDIAGEQTVTATYTEGGITKTAEYVITILQSGLSSIAVSDQKTTYTVGDVFEEPTVTATYTNGDTADVTEDTNFSGYDMDTAGEQTVTASYTENGITKTAEYKITVLAVLDHITVVASTSEFKVGQAFVKPIVTAHYVSGKEPLVVTDAATISGYDMSVAGTQTVEVSYTENENTKYASYQITVVENLTDIEIVEPKIDYSKGDEFVKPTIMASFDGGVEDKDVTLEATCSGYDMNTVGEQKVTVTYTFNGVTKTAEFNINVKAILVSITAQSSKVEYMVGDEFVKPTVTALYNGQGAKDVSNDATSTGYNMSKAGKQTVTVSYTEGGVTKTAEYEITVKGKLSSIAIANDAKKDYNVGDAFVAPQVTASYEGGESKVVSNVTFSGYDMSKAGSQTVTASYTEGGVTKTATYQIEVKAAAKGGCGGSIIASSSILCAAALAGVVLMIAKRKKDN